MNARLVGLVSALALLPASALEKRERVAPEAGPALTLAARIRREGARTVARDLYRKPEWAEVLAGVASADPEWLQVGDALRVAADDDAGGEIDLAFAEAIGHSPERVLEYARGLDDPGAFADLCGALPSDEPAPRCERALGRRRRAVQRLDPSRWADQAEACREAIDSAYADLQEEED